MRMSSPSGWQLAAAMVVAAGLLGAAMWAFGGWGPPMRGGHMAEHMGGATAGSADPVADGAPTLQVVATDLAFAPTTVNIPAGQRVNLRLVNDGEAFHDLTIPELDFALLADAGETATGSLIVQQTGAYEFICTVPGHEAAGMRGRLVVDESN